MEALMKRILIAAIFLSLILMLILTSCGRGRSTETGNEARPILNVPLADGATAEVQFDVDIAIDFASDILTLTDFEILFSQNASNADPVIPGGNLRLALILPREVSTQNILHGACVPPLAINTVVSFGNRPPFGLNARVFAPVNNPAVRNPEAPGYFDSLIAQILSPPLIAFQENGDIITGENHNAPIVITIDHERHTVTKTFRDNVALFWHDGVPLTMDDLLYMYERMIYLNRASWDIFTSGDGHPLLYISGAMEFASGNADNISGITISPDMRSMEVEFISLPNRPLHRNDFAYTALPRHHLIDMTEIDFHRHPNTRQNVIGYGAFQFESLVFNQEVTLVANNLYWQGRPLLDSVTFHVLSYEQALERLYNGTIDILEQIHTADIDGIQDSFHLQLIGNADEGRAFMYFFILGQQYGSIVEGEPIIITSPFMMPIETRTFNYVVDGWIPRDDGHPITNPNVRRAIAYAMDESIIVNASGGVNVLANTVLNPVLHRHLLPETPGLSHFDLELANQLMDLAGYSWGQHGFRQDIAGNPLSIYIAIQNSSSAELIFQHHRANLAQIGFDLRTATPRSGAEGQFMPLDDIISIFTREPDGNRQPPNADMVLYFAETYPAFWNPLLTRDVGGRFLNDELEALFAEFDTVRDSAHMDELLLRWDALFNAYIPAIPSYWSMNVSAVNTRVTGITAPPGTDEFWRNLANVGLAR